MNKLLWYFLGFSVFFISAITVYSNVYDSIYFVLFWWYLAAVSLNGNKKLYNLFIIVTFSNSFIYFVSKFPTNTSLAEWTFVPCVFSYSVCNIHLYIICLIISYTLSHNQFILRFLSNILLNWTLFCSSLYFFCYDYIFCLLL